MGQKTCISIIINHDHIQFWIFNQKKPYPWLIAHELWDLAVHSSSGLHNPTALRNALIYVMSSYQLKKPTIALTLGHPYIEEYMNPASLAKEDGRLWMSHALAGSDYHAAINTQVYCQYLMWARTIPAQVAGIFPQKRSIAALAHALNLGLLDYTLPNNLCAEHAYNALKNQDMQYITHDLEIAHIDQCIIALGLYYLSDAKL